jgi:hypothetical protein
MGILNLGKRWKCVVSIMPWPIYLFYVEHWKGIRRYDKQSKSSSNLLAVLIVKPLQGHAAMRNNGRNVRMKNIKPKKKGLETTTRWR